MTAATLTDADFLRRLAKATGRACGLSGGFYYCELSGGLTGWIQPHPDTSCLQVVIASYLGLHPCEVPCPPVDQRLADGESVAAIAADIDRIFAEWAAERGLKITPHRVLPVGLDLWIGVVPQPGPMNHHVMLMRRRQVLFEPFPHELLPRSWRVKRHDLNAVRAALTIEREEV